MRFEYDDMLNELMSGTDPATIAEAFTKNLNDAITAAKKYGPYENAITNFTNAWNELLDAYVQYEGDPGFDVEWMTLTTDDVKNFIPSLMKIGKLAKEYCEIFKITNPDRETEPDFDELVADFLNQ